MFEQQKYDNVTNELKIIQNLRKGRSSQKTTALQSQSMAPTTMLFSAHDPHINEATTKNPSQINVLSSSVNLTQKSGQSIVMHPSSTSILESNIGQNKLLRNEMMRFRSSFQQPNEASRQKASQHCLIQGYSYENIQQVKR